MQSEYSGRENSTESQKDTPDSAKQRALIMSRERPNRFHPRLMAKTYPCNFQSIGPSQFKALSLQPECCSGLAEQFLSTKNNYITSIDLQSKKKLI